MGTHPIFESDFDCLTDHKMQQEQQSGDSGALSQSTFLPTPALSSTPAKGADAVNEKAGGKGFDADIGHLNSRLATMASSPKISVYARNSARCRMRTARSLSE